MLCWLEFVLIFSHRFSILGLWFHLLASVGTAMKPSVDLFS